MAYNPNNPNGQATSANSSPVVIASDQSALPISDNGGSITVDGSVTISGTVTANAGTGTLNVSVQNASIPVTDNGGSLTIDGTVALDSATLSALESITVENGSGVSAVNIQDGGNSITVDGSVSVSNFPATQPISGTVTANAGTGNFTVVQDTAANLNATVSGTVTADTELPTAAALADATATPTTPIVGAALMAFNGTTYDRVRTDGTDNDADPVATTGILSVEAHNQIFNGTSFDRTRSIDALSGTGANNTIVGITAVGTGPGFSHRYNPANLGTAVNSATTIDVEGANTMSWAIGATTTGTILFEGTADATNWFSLEVFDASADLWVSGQNITPTLGKVYYTACGGLRQVRARVTAILGATLSHFVTVTNSQQLLAGIDTGAAPHNFGYTPIHKDAEYTTTQTGTNIWVPTTGRKFVVTDLTITTGGTTAGIVTLFQAATGTTAYSAGTTPAIFRGEFAPSATAKPGVVKPFPVPYISTTTDHTLHVTTSAAMTVYIQINGYEIL